jgi:hypothetical protein
MSKSKKTAASGHDNKGFLELAGEALSVLGTDIADGKDKVVEVASEKITVFKRAVGNIIHKKSPAKSSKPKAAVKKKAKPPAKERVKKPQPKRPQPKKTAKTLPKKQVKKVTKKAIKQKK